MASLAASRLNSVFLWRPAEPSAPPEGLPGDELKILEYVKERASKDWVRLSTPFKESTINMPPVPPEGSSPGTQVLNLDRSPQADLSPHVGRQRVPRPVRSSGASNAARMSKSQQWEAELERELERERQKSKTPLVR